MNNFIALLDIVVNQIPYALYINYGVRWFSHGLNIPDKGPTCKRSKRPKVEIGNRGLVRSIFVLGLLVLAGCKGHGYYSKVEPVTYGPAYVEVIPCNKDNCGKPGGLQ